MHDIRSLRQDIRTTCPKCGTPIELSSCYCKECTKLMKRRRELPWLARTLLWLGFVSACVILFLAVENTPWMQRILRGLGW